MFALGQVIAKNFAAVIFPEFVEGFSGVCAIADDGLSVIAIDDFPGFAESGGRMGEFAVINRFKFPPAPDALDVKGLESDGGHVGLGDD